MGWILGIDFGTSYTTAAIASDGRPEPIEIDGQRRMPSVVLVDEDGSVVVGAAAESLSATRPGRTLREPKRRLGEPTPVVLGGEPYAVVDLVGALLAAIREEAVRHQGCEPAEVRLTHPASWGRPRLAELRRAAAVAGMPSVTLVPEPVAAAVAYSSDASEAANGYVAVYDLGGGTFDTAVLRRTDDGFTIHGRPGGDPRLGGELFDELLTRHVTAQLPPEAASAIVASDELAWRQAAANLRNEARAAKETLSSRDYAELLVALPTGLSQVRVTRAELEALISDYIDETVDLLAHAVSDAGVGADQLSAIYVTGGASRAPMIEERLRARFPDVAVSRRNDPKMVVAIGATLPEATAALDSTREIAVVDEPTVVKGTIVSTEELQVPPPVAAPLVTPVPPPSTTFETTDPAAAATIEAAAPAATPGADTNAPAATGVDAPTPAHPDGGTRLDSTVDAGAIAGGTVVGSSLADGAGDSHPTPVPLGVSSDVRPVPKRRRALVIAAAAFAIVLAVGGIAVFAGGGDGGGKKATPPSSSGGGGHEISGKSVKFDTTTLAGSGMKLDRTWKLAGTQGDAFTSELKVTNPSDKTQLASFEEVIPKEIASDTSKLQPTPGSPKWEVIKSDPIIKYNVGVDPGKTVTLGYQVKVAAEGASIPRLKGWIAAYDKAAAARATEIAAYVKALDADGDGVPVPADACPDQAAPGIANGCPAPDLDPDKDGVPIPTDRCPTQRAVGTRNGCPAGTTPPTTAAPPPPTTTTRPPPPPAPTISISADWVGARYCVGSTIILTAHTTNANSVSWNGYNSYGNELRLTATYTGTKTVSATVTGPGGSAQGSVSYTVVDKTSDARCPS